MSAPRSKPARQKSSHNNDPGDLAFRPEGTTSVPERGELRADPARVRTIMFRSASWFGSSCRAGRLLGAGVGAAVLLAALIVWLAPALAQQATPPVQRSYINPFPNGDRYRVVVLGDSLGDGLWQGLYRAFEDDATLEFINRAKPSTGFARPDSYDWSKEVGDLLKNETYQIAVIMFGANDAQPIKTGKDWLKVGSEGWREIYGQRVEAFIKKLRAANIAVYWVGLPIMRSPAQSSDAEALNEVYREKAFINGAKFIDTWNGFTDEGGRLQRLRSRHDRAGQAAQGRRRHAFHHARLSQARPFRGEGAAPRSEPRQARAEHPARRQRGGAGQGHGTRRGSRAGRIQRSPRRLPTSKMPRPIPIPCRARPSSSPSSARRASARGAAASAPAKQCRRREPGEAGDRPVAPGGARACAAGAAARCPRPR